MKFAKTYEFMFMMKHTNADFPEPDFNSDSEFSIVNSDGGVLPASISDGVNRSFSSDVWVFGAFDTD